MALVSDAERKIELGPKSSLDEYVGPGSYEVNVQRTPERRCAARTWPCEGRPAMTR